MAIMVEWFVTGLMAVMHPFFVSVIEINHNSREASVEISVRIFSEDLEKTLQKYTTAKVDMVHPTDKALLDKQINAYLSQKLKLRINGQPVAMQYIGHELQKESVWTYFEISKIAEVKKIEVNCGVLFDYEKNQTNIFHVKSKGVEKSFKLDYPATKASFDF